MVAALISCYMADAMSQCSRYVHHTTMHQFTVSIFKAKAKDLMHLCLAVITCYHGNTGAKYVGCMCV